MKKSSVAVAALFALITGSSFAQSPTGEITMSRDPAKVAEVERHAEELKAHPQPTSTEMPTTKTAHHHGKKHHAQKLTAK